MALTSDDNYTIAIKTTGDTKGVKDTESALGGLSNQTEKSHSSFLKMASAVAVGEAAFRMASTAITGIGRFLGDTVKSANESENALSQLEAVLKSTHYAAKMDDDVLVNMANALQKVTTYSDEAVMGAESLLLTFTNVKGKVFEDSIPLILDMSTALGQDLKSSSIQLGKALNDPIKGITALSRVGVSFTATQKDSIKAMVDHGKTAEAQQVILKELRTEFGGSAAAAGKTFAGSMERLKNQMDDVKESIGGVIVRGITPFVTKAADFVASVNWEDVIGKSKESLKKLTVELLTVWRAIDKVYQQVEHYLEPKFMALWHTLDQKLIPQLEKLWKNVIQPMLPVLGVLFVGAIGLVIDYMNWWITVVTDVISWLEKHKLAVEVLVAAITPLLIAFAAVRAAMMMQAAFAAFSAGLATVGASFAGLAATMALPIVMPAIAVGAALAALALVYSKAKDLDDLLNKNSAEASKAGNYQDDFFRSLKKAHDTGKINDAEFKRRSTAFANGQQWAEGGFTGTGGKHEVAGIVHKGEYVIPQSQVNQSTGKPKASMGGTTINQTNHIYNQYDMTQANIELGWRLAHA